MEKPLDTQEFTCDQAAAAVERLIHNYGVESIRGPLAHCFRIAAEKSRFEVWKGYHLDRAEHFAQALAKPQWHSFEAGPPEPGWEWEIGRVHLEERSFRIQAWVPPELAMNAEPVEPSLFDAPQGKRPQIEKIAMLGLIYEAVKNESTPLYHEAGEPEDAVIKHAAHLERMRKMVANEREHGFEPGLPLREWIAEFEEALAQTKGMTAKHRKSRRGRKCGQVTFDPAQDARLERDWKAVKSSGSQRKDFCKARGIALSELTKALTRQRDRRLRKQKNRGHKLRQLAQK